MLDQAEEKRALSPDEIEFRKFLKGKVVGLAAIETSRLRHHARLT